MYDAYSVQASRGAPILLRVNTPKHVPDHSYLHGGSFQRVFTESVDTTVGRCRVIVALNFGVYTLQLEISARFGMPEVDE
jgi:hypothetical protein